MTGAVPELTFWLTGFGDEVLVCAVISAQLSTPDGTWEAAS
jgi:hypothetical protein